MARCQWCSIALRAGKSFQDELVTVKGTRKQLYDRLASNFREWSPHDWIDRWTTHQRHLTYATFRHDELCISTDFSAQYEHKAFCTRTCEHPARSNMDVFIVTHSPHELESGERVVTTDVWRFFSEAKGSSLFHNTALDDVVKHYRERLGLKRVYVFSDGCRSQYKGKRNFRCIATFASRSNGVELVHRFAASHHFKGPHDAYGKDAKYLCRCAERNKKARLPGTYDIYRFCATTLPKPRRGVTAEQIVEPLPEQPPEPERSAEQQEAERRAAAEALAAAATTEGAAAIAARLDAAGITRDELPEEAPTCASQQGRGSADDVDVDGSDADADSRGDEGGGDDGGAAAADAEAVVDSAQLDAEPEEEGGDLLETPPEEHDAQCDAQPTRAADAEVSTAATEQAGADEPRPSKRRRRPHKWTILSQAPGSESSSSGVRREEEQQAKRPGMFAASNYFWVFYSARPGLKVVPIGQLAQMGECHGYLDSDADMDADSISGSNSTYDFAGVCPEQPELLDTRVYPCACRHCRRPGAVGVEYASCPYMSTCGQFKQRTIHGATGVAKRREVQKVKVEVFAGAIKADHLYAAYASYRERGNRDYWLLRARSTGKKAAKAIKVAGGNTIRKGTWVVEAQWYLSTSDNQGRKSYSLLEEIVHVPVGSIVQEHGLEWQREGRHGRDNLLSTQSHVALMAHNFSNVDS